MEQPDGIIITISQQMLKEKGLLNWTRNFLKAMSEEDTTYWMRLGAPPKKEVLYVYLCIGGKVRYRANFVGIESGSTKTFREGNTVTAKTWCILAGPVEKPTTDIPFKGFRGFRYCQKLF